MRDIKEITEDIGEMDDLELAEVIKAILRRFDNLKEDTEAVFITLPRSDTRKRREILLNIADFAERHG